MSGVLTHSQFCGTNPDEFAPFTHNAGGLF
jgi:hypothetical protein